MKEYRTPFSSVCLYKNGERMEFSIMPATNWYSEQGDAERELYRISLDMKEVNPGDVIVCEYSDGNLSCDGGGENMLNIVGIIGKYTVGMGTVDTAELGNSVPYELYTYTNRGFEVHVNDTPVNAGNPLLQIYFLIAWVEATDDIAWNMVSCATS